MEVKVTQDLGESTFGDIFAAVVWNGRATACLRMPPYFVAAGGPAIELETEPNELPGELTMGHAATLKAGEISIRQAIASGNAETPVMKARPCSRHNS